jgi:hypothetical protein
MGLLEFIHGIIFQISGYMLHVDQMLPICRHGALEHPILALIAVLFSNPLVPDFGTQFLTALIIGMLLPSRVIDPIYNFMKRNLIEKISILKKFEKGLYKHPRVKKIMKTKNERLKTIIPRIIAGYVVTYTIAYVLLLYLCVILR